MAKRIQDRMRYIVVLKGDDVEGGMFLFNDAEARDRFVTKMAAANPGLKYSLATR